MSTVTVAAPRTAPGVPPPLPGQLWLVRPASSREPVAAIRSRESDTWTTLCADRSLTVLSSVELVRPIPGDLVPADATWDERVHLLAGFHRPYAGAR